MNILERIIAQKRIEVAADKERVPVESLLKSVLYRRKTFSLKGSLHDISKNGIIAEFKRQSPSKGIINNRAEITEVTTAYAKNGASGISVLTDQLFFGGSNEDLVNTRIHDIPLLRKDFIIDEYQVTEARAIGADVILLIASCLTPARTKELAFFAKQLEMEVLLEIHDETELGHICDETELVGVNNRDLKTFTVDIGRSVQLVKMIPEDKIKIAESGIDSVATFDKLRKAGFHGFLMGERFMNEADPGMAFTNFSQELNRI